MKTITYSMTRLRRALTIGTAFSAALFAASALQAQTTTDISHSAKEFLQEASQANQTEIAMANLAETRSQNPTVKDLAQMMSSDHQQNYAQVQSLALNHSVALEAALSASNERAVDRLRKASDADFDKDYVTVMLKDHVKCIKRFDKAVADIQEPSIREYAQNTLPALRKHLRHSEDAARAVGVDDSTINSILKGLPSEEAQRGVTFNR